MKPKKMNLLMRRVAGAVYVFVLLAAMVHRRTFGSGRSSVPVARASAPRSGVVHVEDVTIRRYGPLLPLSVSALLWCGGKNTERSGSIWPRWVDGWKPLVPVVAIAASRLVLFLMVHKENYYISDHIFLITSMLAMLQCDHANVAYGLYDYTPGLVRQALLILAGVTGAVLYFVCLVEAWVTASYYHTPEATAVALVSGGLIFNYLMAGQWWEGKVAAACAGREESKEHLLCNAS